MSENLQIFMTSLMDDQRAFRWYFLNAMWRYIQLGCIPLFYFPNQIILDYYVPWRSLGSKQIQWTSEIRSFRFRTLWKVFHSLTVRISDSVWNPFGLLNTKPVRNRFVTGFLLGWSQTSESGMFKSGTLFRSVCQTERSVFGRSLYSKKLFR